MCGQLVRRMALSADTLFGPEDAAKFRQRVDQHSEDQLHAPLTVGLSRLLPSAKGDGLDDPQTRDGVLRTAIQQEKDVFAHGSLAAELVRVGLPANLKFLKEQFFAEKDSSWSPDMRVSILQELGRAPLTAAKREALADLLLDERFRVLWMESSHYMGDGTHRQYAIPAVNAHLGRQAITYVDEQNLSEPQRAGRALLEVLERVKELKSPTTRE